MVQPNPNHPTPSRPVSGGVDVQSDGAVLQVSLSPERLGEVVAVLTCVGDAVRIADTALAQIEVVHGIRLIEPCNGLSQQMRELNWAIAALNGMTQLPAPVDEMSREISRVLGALRPQGMAPSDPAGESGR